MRDEALLVEVLMSLGKAEFIEQILVHESKRVRDHVEVFGATEGRRVYVNPLHHKRRDEIVSTLLHEGIHRIRWAWKERSVIRAEKRLARLLTQEQSDVIYRVYKQAVRRLKGVREI